MMKNPYLHGLFASGYFDLATPFFAAEYTIDHLDARPDLLRNIIAPITPAGHMMYHNRA